MSIHSTAVIDSRAEIHPEADIGPFVVVEGPVQIGRGTRVMAHVTLLGHTEIGEQNEIHPGAVLGDTPQDAAYNGELSYLKIGNNNIIREYVQIHRGTKPESSTVIGDQNFLMACSHVGHNCTLGNQIVMANSTALGGYVEVADQVFLSAQCLVHQFVRVGTLSLMRGLSGTSRDVPPFSIVDWQHTVRGVNVVGLKRAGFNEKRIREIREAFRILFRKGRNLSLAVKEVEEKSKLSPDVVALIEFIKSSERGVCIGG